MGTITDRHPWRTEEAPMSDETGHELEFSFKSITGGPIERRVYKTTLTMGIISAIGLTSMMLITVYDVTMRFFFSKPLYGVYELVGMILVLTSTFGMALCQKDRSHITITLITDMLPLGLKATSEVFALLMSFICYGIITWQMFVDTIDFFASGIGGLSADLGLNWGYVSAVFVIGSFVFTIVLLMQFIKSVDKLIKR
jgi:TRAP-type C4-dicarboxylate transport system permease small subunit